MTLSKLMTAIFVLCSGSAIALDAPVRFQCEDAAGQANPGSPEAQGEPISIEITNKAVKVSGVGALDSSFTLIQMDEKFYVFKNKKNQGGNINRTNGVFQLYAVDRNAHKMTVSINGVCKQE